MNDPKDIQVPAASEKKARMPYERPAVISEEVFETLALACASGRLSCPPGNPNRS
jgi:hypothetical protein